MGKLLFVVFGLAIMNTEATPRLNLEDSLARKLRTGSTANIILTMAADTTELLNKISAKKFTDRSDRLNAVANGLQGHANETQRSVIDYLSKKSISFESFWVSNQIFIKEASKALVDDLFQFDSIKEITEELIIRLEIPIIEEDQGNLTKNEVQWGIAKIEADKVWAGGNRGEGIVVGGIDTGVRKRHESLRENFLGAYGWFDPGNQNASASPSDNYGHGTHTIATIVGANGIGVAPSAKWVACRGCISNSLCHLRDLIFCGQFMTCPTLPDKSKPDCSKAPHVVSNSWSLKEVTTNYNRVIQAWRAGGIIPVFSQGNTGPNCGTANSPGDNADVIGVGSTTSSDSLSYFSSVGPVGRRIKPDITAPGSNVYSASHTSDTAYITMSGTSMACPHTAGAVALILSASRGQATYSEITEALYSGAETNVIETGKNCGGVAESNFPNNAFGHGRLNVNKAVQYLTQ